MRDPGMVWVVLSGVLCGLGVAMAVAGMVRRQARLADALALVAGGSPSTISTSPTGPDLRHHDGDLPTRLGDWVFTRLQVPLGDDARRTLALQGRSIGDFMAEKLLFATMGLALPLVLTAVLHGLGALVAPLPVAATLALAAMGWFWPDVALRRADTTVKADAGEALFTFLDLVTLERLGNASAPQALMSAATMSDTPLFRKLRSSLQRARLEQTPPWQELRRLSRELRLPQVADIADVMRLDDQGAALADSLRARVQELRDAHLLEEKVAAQQVSERMTLWMVIPSVIFGLVFLTPSILKLLGMDG